VEAVPERRARVVWKLVYLEVYHLLCLRDVYSVSCASEVSKYSWLILSPFSAGIFLAFLIPRVPQFAFDQDTPLAPATGDFNSSIPVQFLSFPANFSFPAFAELEIDTGSNFIPLEFTHLNALVFDLDTDNKVGSGDIFKLTVPAKKFTKLQLPINFSYVADNSSDITCK
jgi:hypothetical protein